MNPTEQLATLVSAANAELDDPERNITMRQQAGETPRFELYHAGLSMCSQKVRAVLAEKGVAYRSHEMVILSSKGIYSDGYTPAENYRPGYVRLRMYAGEKLGKAYAEKHTGRSSVDTEGFDPCVVPLLVDHETQQAVADSKLICEHIDREVPVPNRLIPADPNAAAEVMRQVAIVDETPHPGLLYGFHPDDDRRPDFIKGVMQDVHDVKCGALAELIGDNQNDAALVRAYECKIAKEQAGKALAFDADRQRAITTEVKGLIGDLDVQLAAHADPWICGSDYTLADLLWGISLYRMHWLGLANLWKDLPRIGDYAQDAYRRSSVWKDVICWPSPMPPSPHTADIAA